MLCVCHDGLGFLHPTPSLQSEGLEAEVELRGMTKAAGPCSSHVPSSLLAPFSVPYRDLWGNRVPSAWGGPPAPPYTVACHRLSRELTVTGG